jgi:hypothetical protein
VVKLKTLDTITISSKWEAKISKEMYESAEIGDTYVSDLKTGKKIIKASK